MDQGKKWVNCAVVWNRKTYTDWATPSPSYCWSFVWDTHSQSHGACILMLILLHAVRYNKYQNILIPSPGTGNTLQYLKQYSSYVLSQLNVSFIFQLYTAFIISINIPDLPMYFSYVQSNLWLADSPWPLPWPFNCHNNLMIFMLHFHRPPQIHQVLLMFTVLSNWNTMFLTVLVSVQCIIHHSICSYHAIPYSK